MNDPKYYTGPIINTSSGEMIPQDEPCFIFRARDVEALKVLEFYWELVTENPANPEHAEAVRQRIEEFYAFKENYPERMKVPDTNLTMQKAWVPRSEHTSAEVGAIAARMMKHEDADVRALAASALTQRPDRG